MKRNVLLLGAGKSAGSFIEYFSAHGAAEQWELTVADISLAAAQQKIKNLPHTNAVCFDIHDEKQLLEEVGKSQLVVSLLPAHMHFPIAVACLSHGRHLVTASYVSPEMHALHQDAVTRDVILMNECGLDPGLDHMSAMEIIERLRKDGDEILSFKSYTGGLVAPESNDNPWGYKFSWNPRNVILAGQGTARYIEEGRYKYIPYNRLFALAETISVEGAGEFDGYANRDSLMYREIYGLENIPTLLRGTLRQKNFCKAWNVFVQLGLTDDSYSIDVQHLSYAGLVEAFLPSMIKGKTLAERLAEFMQVNVEDEIIRMVEWTGVLSDKKIPLAGATPAAIIQQLLESKWKLKDEDKDMIVMQHRFRCRKGKGEHEIISSLMVKGENSSKTAMAKTVGLPLAIVSKIILNNRISKRGVMLPVDKEVYVPVLEEMKEFGVLFSENRTGLL